MRATLSDTGTLYADWLARRQRLRGYHGDREPIVAIQLRVLDYLIERYRDNAHSLRPAPPPLEALFINQRAIVVNHHRSFGLVAGVKSTQEATSRVAAILARMNDPARGDAAEIDLDRAAVPDDPWFAWEEPHERQLNAYWAAELRRLRRHGAGSGLVLKWRIGGMPFLPAAIFNYLYERASAIDHQHGDAADILARCRNRVTVSYVANAWRMRVAAQREDYVTDKLRDTLVNWDRCAADTVRCLLSDECGEVRIAAAKLLADVGELRDIGVFADLLAMPKLPDEEPPERALLAAAMERLATRLQESPSVLKS